MTYVKLASVLLISLMVFSECKKGEDDPKISLRTRKARLAGEWRLVSGSASMTTDGYNEAYVFDGSNVKYTTTLYYPVSAKYVLNLTILKDGTFTFKEFLFGSTLEASGTWNFNAGVGKTKKKEQVNFSIDDVQSGYTYGYNLFNRYEVSFVYTIRELRNKRLVINSSGKIYQNSKGKYITLSTDYIFQQ